MPNPRRSAALFATLVLAAGCAGGGPPPLPSDRISAYFVVGGVVDAIEIDALDRLPMRAAELIAPDGRAIAAGSIAARPAPQSGAVLALPTGAFPGVVSAPGVIGGDRFGPRAVGAAAQTRSVLLATASNAAIMLPDPVAYRRDWRKYRIRLRFGDPPDSDTRELAAPAPPAAL